MKIISIVMLTIAMAAIWLSPGDAHGRGLAANQLSAAGYYCFPAGPNLWIHCLLERKLGKRVVPVKVFSVDGSEFLGTEQLLRDDVYAGQPCPQDGLAQWDSLAVPGYYACHHFDTGHH